MGREEPPELRSARLSYLSLGRGHPDVVALSPASLLCSFGPARSKQLSRRDPWAGSPLSLNLLFSERNGQASGMWRDPPELPGPSLQLPVSPGTAL